MASQVNILISDEPLLLQEASDLIVVKAKEVGVEEIDIVSVNNKFDWSELLANSASMSLFSSVKLTDIRFETKPNKAAQNALIELLQQVEQDDWFIIRLPKLDKKSKSTKWFKSISANARVQELWPPQPQAYQHWVIERAKTHQLRLSTSASVLLAEKTEGNLLAASQAIEKLKLLNEKVSPVAGGESEIVAGQNENTFQEIDKKEVLEVITDSAKFNIFLCIDEALAGNGQRAMKMLKKFQQEGQAPISILVNITREIQYCSKIAVAVSRGQPAINGLQGVFLWENKKRMLVQASSRLPLTIWHKLIISCSQMDKMIKGQASGDIWFELESCLWILSGRNIWKAARLKQKAG